MAIDVIMVIVLFVFEFGCGANVTVRASVTPLRHLAYPARVRPALPPLRDLFAQQAKRDFGPRSVLKTLLESNRLLRIYPPVLHSFPNRPYEVIHSEHGRLRLCRQFERLGLRILRVGHAHPQPSRRVNGVDAIIVIAGSSLPTDIGGGPLIVVSGRGIRSRRFRHRAH